MSFPLLNQKKKKINEERKDIESPGKKGIWQDFRGNTQSKRDQRGWWQDQRGHATTDLPSPPPLPKNTKQKKRKKNQKKEKEKNEFTLLNKFSFIINSVISTHVYLLLFMVELCNDCGCYTTIFTKIDDISNYRLIKQNMISLPPASSFLSFDGCNGQCVQGRVYIQRGMLIRDY